MKRWLTSIGRELKAFWQWCCGGQEVQTQKECVKREDDELESQMEKVRESTAKVKEASIEGRMQAAVMGIHGNDLRRVVDQTVQRLREDGGQHA